MKPSRVQGSIFFASRPFARQLEHDRLREAQLPLRVLPASNTVVGGHTIGATNSYRQDPRRMLHEPAHDPEIGRYSVPQSPLETQLERPQESTEPANGILDLPVPRGVVPGRMLFKNLFDCRE